MIENLSNSFFQTLFGIFILEFILANTDINLLTSVFFLGTAIDIEKQI